MNTYSITEMALVTRKQENAMVKEVFDATRRYPAAQNIELGIACLANIAAGHDQTLNHESEVYAAIAQTMTALGSIQTPVPLPPDPPGRMEHLITSPSKMAALPSEMQAIARRDNDFFRNYTGPPSDAMSADEETFRYDRIEMLRRTAGTTLESIIYGGIWRVLQLSYPPGRPFLQTYDGLKPLFDKLAVEYRNKGAASTVAAPAGTGGSTDTEAMGDALAVGQVAEGQQLVATSDVAGKIAGEGSDHDGNACTGGTDELAREEASRMRKPESALFALRRGTTEQSVPDNRTTIVEVVRASIKVVIDHHPMNDILEAKTSELGVMTFLGVHHPVQVFDATVFDRQICEEVLAELERVEIATAGETLKQEPNKRGKSDAKALEEGIDGQIEEDEQKTEQGAPASGQDASERAARQPTGAGGI
ncbi:hypothetical protein LTR53_002089 [Teratosphaeriaceae sp. CCFEE 6253]|nr:hypothetical protein LTR53_002089 [Teratosphaeriaceae sp. CCFEE 6253]